MAEHRWMKFWPSDWQADHALRTCSLAARGLWIELMAIAHKAEPYGYVLVNGRPPTAREIALIVGAPHSNQVTTLLAELRRAGVFSECEWPLAEEDAEGGTSEGRPEDVPRTSRGRPEDVPMIPQTAIFSRRMVRDAKASEKARIFGSRGGNPALKRVNPTHSLEAEAEAEAEADMISPASQAHPAGKPDGASRASKPKPELKPRRPPAMDGFEEFWRHYPRKVGKGEAERAWPRALAAAGGDVDLIIGGVKVALGTDRLDMREGGRFCPHPATWLNGKRWLDGLDPEPDPQPTLLPRH